MNEERKQTTKTIAYGLLMLAVLVAFLYVPVLFHRSDLPKSLLDTLPESVVAMYIGRGGDSRFTLEEDVPDDIRLFARVLVKTKEGYGVVGLAHGDSVPDGVGISWGNIILFGPEDAVAAVVEMSPERSEPPTRLLPPMPFTKDGTLLFRSSFLASSIPVLEGMMNNRDGWAAFQFSESDSEISFEVFLPTNDPSIVSGRQLENMFDGAALVIDGLRTDVLISEDLVSDITDLRNALALRPVAMALVEEENLFVPVLRVALDAGDADKVEPMLRDVMRERASLLHPIRETVTDEHGRQITHFGPNPDPDRFILYHPIENGSEYRLMCGLALGTHDTECLGRDLVGVITEDMLVVSGSAELALVAAASPAPRGKGSEAFIHLDIEKLERHMDFDMLYGSVSEILGVAVPKVRVVSATVRRSDSGIVIQGKATRLIVDNQQPL